MSASSPAQPPTQRPLAQRWWLSESAKAWYLVAAVVIAYTSVWSAGFIWDDDSHVTANPCIVGPLGLREIWTSSSANYFPLVLTNFWIQHAFWGLAPLPYHLVNVSFHAAAAVLLAIVLRQLRIRAPFFGATVWALHPVQVESVAWISELKNTQSAVFYLLAVYLFLRWLAGSSGTARRRDYVFMLGCAGAALLSKPSTVMLPVVLLLCAWWQQKRWAWRNVVAVAPLLFMSAIASGWTIWEQKFHSFALGPDWNHSFPERLAIAGKAVWFYLGRLLWPDPLMFIYPRWRVAAGVLDFFPVLAAGAALALLWWFRNGRARGAFLASSYFVVLLFPVLGFFNVYFFRYSFVADHFQYLASMGPSALVGAALAILADRVLSLWVWRPALAGALLCTLGWLSWSEAQTFSDATTLWHVTLQRNPGCWLANTILGNDACTAGRLDEALRLEQLALKQNPAAHEAHYDLGLALVKLGRVEDGIAEYESALQLKPNFAEAEHNLGVALARTNRLDDAMTHYNRALRLNPRQPETHCMLGLALTLSQRGAEAVEHYETALKLKPDYPDAHYALARTLDGLGKAGDAIKEYRAVLRLRPDYVDAHTHLGADLIQSGDGTAAVDEFKAAIRLQPQNADIQSDCGTALLGIGRSADAIPYYETALQLKPTFANAHFYLALALNSVGRREESRVHDREAHRLNPALPPLPTQGP